MTVPAAESARFEANNPVLALLHRRIRAAAEGHLSALYLCGSLVAGGFEEGVSDLDLIAVLADELDVRLEADLRDMHISFEQERPEWAGRVEVIYVPARRLPQWRDGVRRMGVISPGEPFHVVTGGPDWVLTWYPAISESVALFGPPFSTFLAPIALQEFVVALRPHLLALPGRAAAEAHARGYAYAVLTLCRGLRLLLVGTRGSKLEAARWATARFPAWREVIDWALAARRTPHSAIALRDAEAIGVRATLADMVQIVEQ